MDPAATLTEEQTELLTDLMVSKLARFRVINGEGGEPPSKLLRHEIQLVIVDTELLLRAADVAAELERWAEDA